MFIFTYILTRSEDGSENEHVLVMIGPHCLVRSHLSLFLHSILIVCTHLSLFNLHVFSPVHIRSRPHAFFLACSHLFSLVRVSFLLLLVLVHTHIMMFLCTEAQLTWSDFRILIMNMAFSYAPQQ